MWRHDEACKPGLIEPDVVQALASRIPTSPIWSGNPIDHAQPYKTTRAPDRSGILNVSGFSDAVFSVVAAFLADDNGRFVAEVEAVDL